MKGIFLLSILLVGYCSISSFHSDYVSRFKLPSDKPLSATVCETFQCSSTPLPAYQCINKSGLNNFLQVCPAAG